MATKRLTARYVETARTKKSREDIADATVQGLQLRVTATGSKTWAIRYRRNSDSLRRRFTLGTYPAVSLEEARTRAREELARVARGADPAAKAKERKTAPTFEDVCNDWLTRHAEPNKSPRAVQDDRSMLERHILPEIGSMKAAEIAKRDIIRLLDEVAAKPDARSKKSEEVRKLTHRPNRVFELVRANFRWAVGRDIVKTDPTAGVSPPIKKEKPRERELSPDEICTFWKALEKAPVKRPMKRTDGDFPMTRATALALLVALATAQRIGEVTGIAISELDLNDTAPMWTVPGERSKNGEPNRVPLSPVALQLIDEARTLAGDCGWLFPNPRRTGPMTAHAATRALGRARDAIGLEDFRVHDLRRTAATRMAEMGINPHTISVVLNHISATRGTITGRVYNRYSYDREKREALNAWGERLGDIILGSDSSANIIARSPMRLLRTG